MPIKSGRKLGRPRNNARASTGTPLSARHHSIGRNSISRSSVQDDQEEEVAQESINVGGFGSAVVDSTIINDSADSDSEPEVAGSPAVGSRRTEAITNPAAAEVVSPNVTSSDTVLPEPAVNPQVDNHVAAVPEHAGSDANKAPQHIEGPKEPAAIATPDFTLDDKPAVALANASTATSQTAISPPPANDVMDVTSPSTPPAAATPTAKIVPVIVPARRPIPGTRPATRPAQVTSAEHHVSETPNPRPAPVPAAQIDLTQTAAPDRMDGIGITEDDANGVEVLGGENETMGFGLSFSSEDVARDAGRLVGAVIPLVNGQLSYENSVNLEDIILRQLDEDLGAYRYDMAWAKAKLNEPDLTPAESRAMQLRTLDCAHQIRNVTHRIEQTLFQKQTAAGRLSLNPTNPGVMQRPAVHGYSAPAASSSVGPRQTPAGTNQLMKRAGGGAGPSPLNPSPLKRPAAEPADGEAAAKRNRVVPAVTPVAQSAGGSTATPITIGNDDEEEDEDVGETTELIDGAQRSLQRLGWWQCRLCTSHKYLLAGPGRLPAAPCKWPLKDISKMISHYTVMHLEHDPSERCKELGEAFRTNRGPLEYWLRRTRGQKMQDTSLMDNIIAILEAGRLPVVLTKFSHAALKMAQADNHQITQVPSQDQQQ